MSPRRIAFGRGSPHTAEPSLSSPTVPALCCRAAPHQKYVKPSRVRSGLVKTNPVATNQAVPILLLRCLESSGCGFENRDDPLKRLSREPCSIERDGVTHKPRLEVNDGLSA